MTKVCPICKTRKEITRFYPHHDGNGSAYCQECMRSYSRKRYWKKRQEILLKAKQTRAQKREELHA
jgi:hypothetical protein